MSLEKAISDLGLAAGKYTYEIKSHGGRSYTVYIWHYGGVVYYSALSLLDAIHGAIVKVKEERRKYEE